MRVRASNIVAGCAALLMLTSVLLYTRTTCRFHPPINQLSDLNSLLTVLHDWELHTDNQADAKTVARIAAQLTTAMEAQQAATHAPPPATSNALTSATYRGQGEPDLLHALAVAGTRCNVAWNTEYWGDPLVWGSTHHTDTAAGCCAACHAHQLAVARGGLDKGLNSTACNTWVHCGDKERCGDMYRQVGGGAAGGTGAVGRGRTAWPAGRQTWWDAVAAWLGSGAALRKTIVWGAQPLSQQLVAIDLLLKYGTGCVVCGAQGLSRPTHAALWASADSLPHLLPRLSLSAVLAEAPGLPAPRRAPRGRQQHVDVGRGVPRPGAAGGRLAAGHGCWVHLVLCLLCGILLVLVALRGPQRAHAALPAGRRGGAAAARAGARLRAGAEAHGAAAGAGGRRVRWVQGGCLDRGAGWMEVRER